MFIYDLVKSEVEINGGVSKRYNCSDNRELKYVVEIRYL